MSEQIAMPFADAPPAKSFAHIVEHNARLVRERGDLHDALIEVGEALGKWCEAWAGSTPPMHASSRELYDYFRENFSHNLDAQEGSNDD